ncbi:MAG TPA: ABC transporter substrate-binding protein [Vicinamibacteria bacterium]|nr:ABC transporter substrate-binding protein [Vicinamibacteria bacterium]
MRVRALVLLALAAAACRRETPSAAAPRTLVIGQAASAITLDPHGSDQTNTAGALSHFYESLVAFGIEMELRPLLAERWENPSETVWRFHLRRGVVFHDGRPLTAEDAVFSLDRARRPESHLAYQLKAVTLVRATDPLTVEVVTSRPLPFLLNRLIYVPIMPRHAGPGPVTEPLGTGPYRFVSGEPGGTLVGHRFEGYWGPRPAFDEVRVVALADERDRATAIAAGRADIVAQFPAEHWGEGAGPSGRLVSRRGLAVVFLGLSLRRGSPFADRRVRQALALAVDREAIVRDSMHGLGAPLDQLVPPWVAGHSNSLKAVPHDPAQARRLLAAAGFKHGVSSPLLVQANHLDVARGFVGQLAAIGVHLDVTVLPQKDFYERWSTEELPATVFGWSAATGDVSAAYEPLLHTPQEGLGRFNRFSYSSARLDGLLALSDEARTPEERRVPLDEAARLVQADWPVIPMVLRHDLYAVRADLDFRPRLDRHVRAMDVRPAGGPQ